MFEMLSLMSEASDESGKQQPSTRAQVFVAVNLTLTQACTVSVQEWGRVGRQELRGKEAVRTSCRPGQEECKEKHSNRTYEVREGL